MATLSITTAIAIVVVGMILTAGSNPVIGSISTRRSSSAGWR